MGTVPDCLGRPQAEARELLQAVGLKFSEEITRPTRDFFQIDDSSLYLVRQLLVRTAFPAVPALLPARLKLSARVRSATKSTRRSASSAVHARLSARCRPSKLLE